MKSILTIIIALAPTLTFARLSDDVELSANPYAFNYTSITGSNAKKILEKLSTIENIGKYNIGVDHNYSEFFAVGEGFILKKNAGPTVQLDKSTAEILDYTFGFSTFVKKQISPFESLDDYQFHSYTLCSGMNFLTKDGDYISYYEKGPKCPVGPGSTERLLLDWSYVDSEIKNMVHCFEVFNLDYKPASVACVFTKDKFNFKSHKVDTSRQSIFTISGEFNNKLRAYMKSNPNNLNWRALATDKMIVTVSDSRSDDDLAQKTIEYTRSDFARNRHLVENLPTGVFYTKDNYIVHKYRTSMGETGFPQLLMNAERAGVFDSTDIDCYDGGSDDVNSGSGHGGGLGPISYGGTIATCVF